jgi:hypothetical protein
MQNDSYFKMKMSVKYHTKQQSVRQTLENIGCSFKFLLKVRVEESIVNAPHVSLRSKSTINAKSEVRFKQLILIRDR